MLFVGEGEGGETPPGAVGRGLLPAGDCARGAAGRGGVIVFSVVGRVPLDRPKDQTARPASPPERGPLRLLELLGPEDAGGVRELQDPDDEPKVVEGDGIHVHHADDSDVHNVVSEGVRQERDSALQVDSGLHEGSEVGFALSCSR